MTRLTRSLPCGPPHSSSGGWLNTTMSPSRTSCQVKNAFWTRIRSYTPSVGTMDDEGIQKVWNANARTRPASSTARRRLDHAEPLEPVQRAVEGAGPQFDACEL